MEQHTVYVLHFDHPYWKAGNSICQHYVGYTKDLPVCLDKHRAGNGSKLCAYAVRQGITFELVHEEHYPSQSEARKRKIWIKRHGGGKRFCSLCQGVL